MPLKNSVSWVRQPGRLAFYWFRSHCLRSSTALFTGMSHYPRRRSADLFGASGKRAGLKSRSHTLKGLPLRWHCHSLGGIRDLLRVPRRRFHRREGAGPASPHRGAQVAPQFWMACLNQIDGLADALLHGLSCSIIPALERTRPPVKGDLPDFRLETLLLLVQECGLLKLALRLASFNFLSQLTDSSEDFAARPLIKDFLPAFAVAGAAP